MKTNSVHYTWMAFSLAAIVMLTFQHNAPERVSSLNSTVSSQPTFEHNADQRIQPVALPVVVRQATLAGSQTPQQPSWTF